MLKRALTWLSVVAGGISLAGCSPVDLLNWTVPRTGYTVEKDIPYGTYPRQTLDIYRPQAAANGRTANKVIIFFYGGSWQSGEKAMYRFVGQAFASKGFTTVIADYRLYPSVRFPVFLHDGAQALAWVHQHISRYQGDPDAIYLVGHSAGAYNAVMLALDPAYVKHANAKPEWIKGVVGLAGPYDFLPFTDPEIKAIFSTAKDEATQPITYAHANTAPMLLLAGADDEQVYPKNTINLAAKLKTLGSPTKSKIYPDIGHIGIVLSLARGFRDKASTLDDTTQFILTH